MPEEIDSVTPAVQKLKAGAQARNVAGRPWQGSIRIFRERKVALARDVRAFLDFTRSCETRIFMALILQVIIYSMQYLRTENEQSSDIYLFRFCS